MYASLVSDPRRKPVEQAPEPRAKVLGRPVRESWRVELALWSADDRFAWAERAAILIADAGLPPEDAEHAAFHDVAKYRVR